jgi:hypothetical protein
MGSTGTWPVPILPSRELLLALPSSGPSRPEDRTDCNQDGRREEHGEYPGSVVLEDLRRHCAPPYACFIEPFTQSWRYLLGPMPLGARPGIVRMLADWKRSHFPWL